MAIRKLVSSLSPLAHLLPHPSSVVVGGGRPLSSFASNAEDDKTVLNIETIIPFVVHRCEPPASTVDTTTKELLGFFRHMSLIRRMELAAKSLYKAKLIRGFCHLYDGQEAIAIGMEVRRIASSQLQWRRRRWRKREGCGGGGGEGRVVVGGHFNGKLGRMKVEPSSSDYCGGGSSGEHDGSEGGNQSSDGWWRAAADEDNSLPYLCHVLYIPTLNSFATQIPLPVVGFSGENSIVLLSYRRRKQRWWCGS